MNEFDLIVDTGEDFDLTVKSESVTLSTEPIPNINLSIDKPIMHTMTMSKDKEMEMGMDMNVIVGGGGVPYSGDYTVTPTRSTQVLATKGKSLQKNITVEPIPKNYGLITWNGSTLTVS